MWSTIRQVDESLFLFLNGIHSSFLDVPMLWITGKFTWIPLYFFIIYFIFREFPKQKAIYSTLILIALVGLADFVTSGLMKPYFQRPRPCYNQEIEAFIHLVDGCGGKFGFASSHAANTFALFGGLLFLFTDRKVFVYLMLFWAILVSYSRIYVGVHYPLDVLIGALIGFVLGFVIFKILSKWVKQIQ